MDDPQVTRRRALGGLAGGSAAILSGCLDSLPIVGKPPAPEVDPMPQETTVFVTVDVPTLLNDDGFRAVADEAVPITDVESLLGVIEDRTGLDPMALGSLTAFDTVGSESGDSAGGVIFDASWSMEALRSALDEQGVSTTATMVAGHGVYDLGGYDATLGTLADGRYVVGTGRVTADVLDVDSGDAKTVGGDFRRAYGRTTDGPIRFAARIGPMADVLQRVIAKNANLLSEDVIGGVRYVGGSMYAAGEKRGIQLRFSTKSETSARQVVQFSQAVPGYANKFSDDQELLALLGDFEEKRHGTRVTVTYEGTPADLEPLASALGQQLLGFVVDRYPSVLDTG